MDVEGFSHLFVGRVFDRSEGFTLVCRAPPERLRRGWLAEAEARR